MQVQALLKKLATLDVETICPLHGPVLTEKLDYYIGKYQLWSSYEPEEEGVLIAVASIHGHTMQVAERMKDILEGAGVKKVELIDLARDDVSEAVEHAFMYSHLLLAAASYDAGVFPPMENFLHHLKAKNYQKRTVGIIENGSWGPTAGRTMKAILDGMKDINVVEPLVTIKSSLKSENIPQLEELSKNLCSC